MGVECQVFFKIDTQFYRRISSLFYIFIYFIEWFATIWWLASFWYDTGSDNCMNPSKLLTNFEMADRKICPTRILSTHKHSWKEGRQQKKQSNYRDILFQVGITKRALSLEIANSFRIEIVCFGGCFVFCCAPSLQECLCSPNKVTL